ncbi:MULTISPECIES: hypothetical protein [Gallibacterium]|uniref:hypothetical protein n=1 Tax=Gallibacterium TaxID=155493 RepID=UPI000532123B|nr:MULTISPECIES: hypothetical protein [Gallibacterium]KGQ46980.1 hypothetical protein JL04_12110 [Gallibacterium anatis]MBP4134509.1 stationary phase growth adaptation protein [Gallibacterium anatis]MDA3977677.1 stationary phase growth adaptation protein [Gallibacterium sp. AGMB14963]HDV0780447.1 stationary phase growth adaptation protein [Acinetobacter baumannii]
MKLDKQSTFKPFIYNKHVFDLSHLNASIVKYVQEATDKEKTPIEYQVYVTYSMHCFTKDYPTQTEEEKQKLMYVTNRESRPFCFKRYELSKHLPSIIQNLAHSKIGFAGYDNFATIKIFDEARQETVFYKVTFVMYRFEKKLRLHISSAYPIEKWEKLKPIGFFKIAQNILKGKKLRKP